MNKQNINKILRTPVIILLLVLSIFSSEKLWSTHIVGGDMTYKRIGANKFQITLSLRRDCFLGAADAQFDKNAKVGIFKDNFLFREALFPFMEDDTLNNFIQSDCGFEGTQVCVHETRYIQEIDLPFSATGYTIAYQRCCRNSTINNIVDPLETGATYFVHIPATAFSIQNSTPFFNKWPDIYICANQQLNYDTEVKDADGDSLVYKLCNPKIGLTRNQPSEFPTNPPFEDLTWAAPFGLSNLMGGVPLKIDARTGRLTAIPNAVGQYVVGICVEEYRNGVKIGEIQRDFQYNVRICSTPPTALFDAPSTLCNETTVNFNNKSLASNRYEWDFNFPSTNPAFKSSLFNPSFTFPGNGTYQVKLTSIRNSDNCRSEKVMAIRVTNIPYNADLNYDISTCNPDGTITVTLNDASTTLDTGTVSTKWKWVLTQGNKILMDSVNPAKFNINPADFQVKFDVEASSGCNSSITRNLKYEDKSLNIDFKTGLVGCSDGNSINVRLEDLSQGLNDNFIISERTWTIISASETTQAFGVTPTVRIPKEDYKIRLDIKTDKGCIISKEVSYKIRDFVPALDFDLQFLGCFGSPDARTIFRVTTPDTLAFSTVSSYNWTINGQAFDTKSVPYIGPYKEDFAISLRANYGLGCSVLVERTIKSDSIRPKINFNQKPISCSDDLSVNYEFKTDKSDFKGLKSNSVNWLIGPATNRKSYNGDSIVVSFDKDSIILADLVVIFNNGCSDTLKKVFGVGPFAKINPLFDSLTMCKGDSTALISQGNPAFTYTWNPTTNLNLIRPWAPTLRAQKDQIYTVIVSDGLCSVRDTFVIDVLESIDLVITGDSFTCDGNVSLTANGAFGSGTYQWSDSPSFVNILGEGEAFTTKFEGLSKTFYLRFKGDVCEANSTSVTILNETPRLQLSNLPICAGDSLLISPVQNLVSTHTLSYGWEVNPRILATRVSPSISVFALPGDNNLAFILNTTNQFGCRSKDTLNLKVNQNGESTITYKVEDCNTNKVCFAFTSNDSLRGTYLWNFGDGNTSTEKEPCHVYSKPGTYKVKLSNNSPYCPFNDKEIDLLLNSSLPVFDKDSIEACLNADINLPFPSKAEGRKFIWKNNKNQEISTEKSPKVNIASDTLFILNVLDDNGCGFNDTLYVNTFKFNLKLSTDTACTTGTYQIKSTINPGINFDYVWSPASAIVSGGNGSQPFVDVAKATSYTVKVTHQTLGCMTTDSVKFKTFNFDLKLSVADTVCSVGAYQIKTTINPGINFTYVWSPASAIVSGGNGSQPFVDVAKATSFSVKVTHPTLGCMTTDSVKFNKFIFDYKLNVPLISCINQTTMPSIDVRGGGIYQYVWSPSNLVVTGINSPNPSINITGPTEIKVQVTNTKFGCVLRDSFKITPTIPPVEVKAEPTGTVAKGQIVKLSIVNPTTGWTYKWSNNFTGTTQEVKIDEATTFTVTVTDNNGCTNTTSIIVDIRPPLCEQDVYLPKAFSPNGDGNNDVFYLRSNYIQEVELIVYNRWNQELFKTTDISKGWDGTFNGDELSPDVYAYWYRAKCTDGKEVIKRGNVSLLR